MNIKRPVLRDTMLTVAEDEHDGGVDREYGLMWKDPAGPWRRTRVVQRVARQAQLAYAATVRLDGERAGELPAAMSTRYKGLVRGRRKKRQPATCEAVRTDDERGFQIDLRFFTSSERRGRGRTSVVR